MSEAVKYHGKTHAEAHAGGSKTSLSSFFIILDIMGDRRRGLGKYYKGFVV